MDPGQLFTTLYDRQPKLALRLATLAIPRLAPISAGLRIRATALDARRAEVKIPFTKRAKNHVNTMYLAPQIVACEVAMALLALNTCRPPKHRVLVKRLETDFLRRITKTARAVCAPNDHELDALYAARDMPPGKTEVWLSSRLLDDKSGEEMARARFLLSIKRNR